MDYVPDDKEISDGHVYNKTPLRQSAKMAARLGIGHESMAKLLTSYNGDIGRDEIVTEKKVRCQKSIVFKEALTKRIGKVIYGNLIPPLY